MLGWTPVLQNKVRSTARRGLARHMQESGTEGTPPAR
jgi:hypothetical protein